MRRWNNFEANEGELVWALRAKFKGETDEDYVLSKAPEIMPYLIIKKEDNKYAALILTKNAKPYQKYFTLSHEQYRFLYSPGYVNLSSIYQLEEMDVVDKLGEISNSDLNDTLSNMILSFFNNDIELSDDEIKVLKKVYNENNYLNLGDLIGTKEDNQFKRYIIINKPNRNTFTGVSCKLIFNEKTMLNDITLDFDDCKTFQKNNLLYYKLKNSLSAKKLATVMELRNQYYRDRKLKQNDTDYNIGDVVKINGYNYIVLDEDNKNYYVTSYQNRHLFCDIQAFNKEYSKCEYIETMEASELLSVLINVIKCSKQKNRNHHLEVDKKITEKVKQLRREEKWGLI